MPLFYTVNNNCVFIKASVIITQIASDQLQCKHSAKH